LFTIFIHLKFIKKKSIKQELEKAWKVSDSALEKEQSAKEAIDSLKEEIANLTKLVEQGAGLTVGQEQNVSELVKTRDELIAERDNLLDELVKLRSQLEDSHLKQADLERKIDEASGTIKQLEDDITRRNVENQRELRRKDKLEKELKDAKAQVEQKSIELKNLQQNYDKAKMDSEKLETQHKELKVTLERTLKDSDVLNNRLSKLKHDFDGQISTIETLANENALKVHELKVFIKKKM
jgi:chromosome segregation ATPase